LLTVVQTALGISPLTSAEPLDTQAHLLSKLVNISDFKNPAKLQSFIERFAAMYDSNNNSGPESSRSTVAALFNLPANGARNTYIASSRDDQAVGPRTGRRCSPTDRLGQSQRSRRRLSLARPRLTTDSAA